MRMLEKLDVALNDPGPGNVPPSPEFGRGGAGHARNRCFASVLMDGDRKSFLFGKRLNATAAVVFPLQQLALVFRIALDSFNGAPNALGNLRNIGFSERRDGNGFFLRIY